MRYLDVCSGISAPTVAWKPLGWEPVAYAEVAPFPSAVLAYHYPNVDNRGDMTKYKRWKRAPVDVLVGGTPCQSYSIAGLRAGMDDPRGELTLTYLAILQRFKPRWFLWENVPGVLSSDRGRAFGTFLRGVEELGYGYAWRTLDAQYFNLAQRRHRVFVVGCLRDWRRAAAVLLEPEGMRGDPAPSRQKGQRTASAVVARAARNGGASNQDVASLLAFGGNDTRGAREVATALRAHDSAHYDFETETMLVSHALRGEGFDASEDGTGRGTPIVPVPFDIRNITSPDNRSNPQPGDPAGTMTRHAQAIAFNARQDPDTYEGYAGALDAGHPQAQSVMQELTGVRRLMPIECERLQGFPDNYTLIPYRGAMAKDSPRYVALGNSMATHVIQWIGRRIELVDNIRRGK